jgi:hypothetical protein
MTETTIMKIHNLVAVYEQLIELLKEANDARLTNFIESTVQSLSQLKQMLAAEINPKIGREMLKGIRQGLRETPELLASISPELSTKLVAEFEIRLGRKLTDL